MRRYSRENWPSSSASWITESTVFMRPDRNTHSEVSVTKFGDLMWTCQLPQLNGASQESRSNGSSGSCQRLPSSLMSWSRMRVEMVHLPGPNIGHSRGNWKMYSGRTGFGGTSMNWRNWRSSLNDSVM